MWSRILSIYSSAQSGLSYIPVRRHSTGRTVPQCDDAVCFEKSGISTDDGRRYIVSDSDVPGYTLVKKCGTIGIYQNKDAAPVMYAIDRVMTEEEYKKLAFPYNQTAFLEYAVVGEHTESSDQNIMTAYEPVSLKMANNRTTGGSGAENDTARGAETDSFF